MHNLERHGTRRLSNPWHVCHSAMDRREWKNG